MLFNLQISNNRNVIRCFFVLIRVISWIVRDEQDSIHEIPRNGTNEISLEPVEGGYSSLSSALSGLIVSAA